MKREGSPPPPRGPGPLADPMKGREGIVPTVKEAGRSIHLIPREPGKDGIITQVYTTRDWNDKIRFNFNSDWWCGNSVEFELIENHNLSQFLLVNIY